MIARQVNGVSVRHGSTRTKKSLAALPADDAAHLPQHVLFHQRKHRGHLVGVDGRVESVGQPLTQQPVRVQTGEQLIDKMRMARLHAVLDDVARQRQQLVVADSFGRQREVNNRSQVRGIHPFHHTLLAGSRLRADKTLISTVIQHVLTHENRGKTV